MKGIERRRAQGGQASVSLVATLPLIGLALLATVQFVIAGHALWSAANAARASARASYAGLDPEDAAHDALPTALADGSTVAVHEGVARVRVEAPPILPLIPPIPVSAEARLGPEDGVPDD